MKKNIMSLIFLVYIIMVFADVRVDVKLRSDDFYANTSFELFNPDPTWMYRGCLMRDRPEFHYKHDNGSSSYGSGAWYEQDVELFYEKNNFLLNANDASYDTGSLYVQMLGWEDDNGSAYSYDDGDDDHASHWNQTNIFDYSQREWQVISNSWYDPGPWVYCGSESDNNLYRMEVSVWWQYTLPGQIEGEVSIIDSNTIQINKTNNNNYRVTSWEYQVSSDSTFINIEYEQAGIIDSEYVISELEFDRSFYYRVRGTNETGTGPFSEPQNFTMKWAGEGTEANPYLITNLIDLKNLSNNEAYFFNKFQQTNDIDATETLNWDDGLGFEPIGNNGDKFEGVFNGAGYSISNLYINRPEENNVGLFGFCMNSVIKNVKIVNCSISGFVSVGGVVGRVQSPNNIITCSASGSVSGQEMVGGLVGMLFDYSEINKCRADVQVVGETAVGGLVGKCHYYSSVSSSYSVGNVEGIDSVGGFIGLCFQNCNVTNCYSTGNVSGTSYVSGFLGNSFTDCIIESSFWNEDTAGIAGTNGGTGLSTIQMNNPLTFIDAGWDFVGETENGSDDVWVFTPYDSPHLSWEDVEYSTNLTSIPQGLEAEVFVLDSSTIRIDKTSNNNYTVSSWEYDISTDSNFSSIESSGSSTSDTATIADIEAETYYYFRIRGVNELGRGSYSQAFYPIPQCIESEIYTIDSNTVRIDKVNNNNYSIASWEYQFSADSSFSTIDFEESGLTGSQTVVTGLEFDNDYYCRIKGTNETGTGEYSEIHQITVKWAGDGTEENPYLIQNLNDLNNLSYGESYFNCSFEQTADIDATETSSWNEGLGFKPIASFRYKFEGFFDGGGYSISNLHINRPQEDYIGLFGVIGEGTLSNMKILSCEMLGNNNVGCLVGLNIGEISNCYTNGNASGIHWVGGLVGSNQETINRCYTSGNTSGTYYIGGLVGSNTGEINNCYTVGTSSGNNWAGALVGVNSGDIADCFGAGYVIGDFGSGGIIGTATETSNVTNSFWNIETSMQISSEGGTGLTTVQMHNPLTFIDAGWDFFGETGNGTDNIWVHVLGDYPHLSWEDVEYSTNLNAIPEGLEAEVFVLDSSSIRIDKTSNNNYNVSSWEYDISTDSSFTTIVSSGSSTSDTATIADIEAETYYYFRIRGLNQSGVGDYSQVYYATPQGLDAELLIVDSNTIQIGMINNDYRITTWDYQISSDEAFDVIVREETNLADNSITIENTDTYQYYYFRVLARNENGEGEYHNFTYPIPTNLLYEVIKIDNNTLSIEKMSNEGFRVISWDYDISAKGNSDYIYNTIASSEEITENYVVIENINTDQELNISAKARNENGEGQLTVISHIIPEVYIDYKVRTDDFYANVGSELGNPDPTWTYDCKFGNNDWLGVVTTHDDGSHMYGIGAWNEQPLEECWVGKTFINDTYVSFNLECWEDDRGSDSTYDSGDDDYSFSYSTLENLLSNPMGEWSDISGSEISSGCLISGSVANNNYYEVELDIWWQYSIPEGVVSEVEITDTNSIMINKTNSGEYRVTSWGYQLSTDEEFTNIVSEGSELTGDSFTILNLDEQQSYYVRVKESNESGDGEYGLVNHIPGNEITLSAPTNIIICHQDNSLQLTWDEVQHATQYVVESSTDLINWETLTETNEPSCAITEDRSIANFYRVTARYEDGNISRAMRIK